jgi:hypothetical protein
MGFNRRKMEDQRRDAAEKEAASLASLAARSAVSICSFYVKGRGRTHECVEAYS